MSSSTDAMIIKIEDSPASTPSPSPASTTAASTTTASAQQAAAASHPTAPVSSSVPDPKDPERFLSRCSGYNKRTGQRCAAVVGAKTSLQARTSLATYLPTCRTHRDQQAFAGWCQFTNEDGERCGRLFRWTPPQFQLCSEHIDHPDNPCHFLTLPIELRQEIFRYLLPSGPISSSTHPLHAGPFMQMQVPSTSVITAQPPRILRGKGKKNGASGQQENPGPFPWTDLLLVNHQICLEAKDLLYSTVSFNIDIRKDGTYMCGRRLLEPKRADGTPHYSYGAHEALARRFVSTFDFASVKNYNIHILVENESSFASWDEEVEIYDIRDYVSVAVTGILSKARNLCKVNIRLALSRFNWSDEELLINTRRLIGPLERLRNVRAPKFCGVYEGNRSDGGMIHFQASNSRSNDTGPWKGAQLCSIPSFPTETLLFGPGKPEFDAYRKELEANMSKTEVRQQHKPPIRSMFTEFKTFYTKLQAITPEIGSRVGKHAFLHKARVAREEEDVKGFRDLRNELIQYWNLHLEREEQKKEDMNKRLCRMLDADTYPSTETRRSSAWDTNAVCNSPVSLEVDQMAEDGIAMRENCIPFSAGYPFGQQPLMATPLHQGLQICHYPQPFPPPQQYIKRRQLWLQEQQQQLQAAQAQAQAQAQQRLQQFQAAFGTQNGSQPSTFQAYPQPAQQPPTVNPQSLFRRLLPNTSSSHPPAFSITPPNPNDIIVIDEPPLTAGSSSSTFSSASSSSNADPSSGRNASISSASTSNSDPGNNNNNFQKIFDNYSNDITGSLFADQQMQDMPQQQQQQFYNQPQQQQQQSAAICQSSFFPDTTFETQNGVSPFDGDSNESYQAQTQMQTNNLGKRKSPANEDGEDEDMNTDIYAPIPRSAKFPRINTGIRDNVIGDVKGKGKAVLIELD